MGHRLSEQAAIYVRTSSEHQAEKSSPEAQEVDCRTLAEEEGLTVTAVYRDVERYRVGRRLVDPSGTRSDRPGLVAMLDAAAAGEFGVILAWREDRLYRGMRAMLLVLETIQDHKIEILLARETFDQKMAPLKAWLAQMELEGMRERMTMGVKARLRAGKANTGQDRYGYQRAGDEIQIVEEEAKWVRQVFDWYIQGTPIMQIRDRLIAANAPQKGSSIPRKVRWHYASIQAILSNASEYASGVKVYTRSGEVFEIPREPIIDMAVFHRVQEVRQANKNHPARHLKNDYLIGGLVCCPCDRKWGARTKRKKRKDGSESVCGDYYCRQIHKDQVHPDCPRTIGAKKADGITWRKICSAIDRPEMLLSEAARFVEKLQSQAETRMVDIERVQKELDSIIEERQWCITAARKRQITEEDMEFQLSALSFQELSLRRELTDLNETVRLSNLDGWEAQAREYLGDISAGLAWLNAEPGTDDEKREQFEARRRVVKALVDRVTIRKGDDGERDLRVVFRLDIPALLEQTRGSIKSAGTYTDRFDLLPLRHILVEL